MKKMIPLIAAAIIVVGCSKTAKRDSRKTFAKEQRVSEQLAGQAEEASMPTVPSKEEGERFLTENAKRAGVKVTASGLQYEVLQEGTGRRPKATDKVVCHYEGRFISGHVFDASYKHSNGPVTFSLDRVITGWTEGLQLMREGAKYRLFIPQYLAYGAEGAPGAVPPYSTLIFDVELISVQ